MRGKSRILAIVGLVIALSGYVFNEIFMLAYGWISSHQPGPYPHSVAILAGTIWLVLIPLGAMLFFLSIVVEIQNRYRREKTDGIWD
ncbi:MAG: hypothetical protein E3J86_00920 [Candidatus Thorarchaeota archaeon]|nr:MAG: hypothetical protein E3J86_00920 [Candidatus Thorarchaeota archaeon]